MLRYKTKEKYQKLKKGGSTPEELRELMIAAGIDPVDIEQAIAELYTTPPDNQGGGVENHDLTNTSISFDYNNLTGESFKNYQAHFDSLPLLGMADFQVFKVDVLMKELYPGLKDSPKEFDGIRITNNKPIHNTRVSPQIANEMNAQVRNTGRYYLLKQ